MTKNERLLRAALMDCQAYLVKHQAKLPASDISAFLEVTDLLRCTELVLTLPPPAETPARRAMPTPVFEASGSFVRGPARPSGSGYKPMVFGARSPKFAQMTAESLNELFAVHCT